MFVHVYVCMWEPVEARQGGKCLELELQAVVVSRLPDTAKQPALVTIELYALHLKINIFLFC